VHKGVRAIRECRKETSEFKRREKNEEIISRNCITHHKIASTFINMHKAARLHLLPMLRYYPMSENVQRDGRSNCKKETHEFKRREKNEEIVSRKCLPHHKIASTFINKHKSAPLHLFSMVSRYYPMSESVQRDAQWLPFHDM
jgi:hypothetical protein